jgi:hypothetical protein
MKINFYEEFPKKENLDKIKLINFPTNLIITSKSINEFKSIKNKIKNYKNKKISDVIYWPNLDEKEGYWFSAFSKHSALKRTINELKNNNKNLTIMWDAELPMLRKSLFFTQLLNYFKNKKLINEFFSNAKNYNIEILTSEYPLENKFFRKILSKLFIVSFDSNIYNNKKIAMLYTSFFKKHKNIEKYLENQIITGKKLYKNNFMVALGCIAPGILGNEPLLNPRELERDLRIMKKNNIKEVVIFRLGGLNKEYIKTIKKFLN